MSIKDDYFVQAIFKDDYESWLLHKHYAHRVPPVSFAYGLFIDKTLTGVCTFGMPPCHFNFGQGIFNNYTVNTWELNRLVVQERLPKNTLSFFVSRCLALLPQPCCVVSFADPNNGHHGYIYQATNWIFTGLSQKGGKDKQWILNGKSYHAKTITIEWMKQVFENYNDSLNMTQNWINGGGAIVENELQKYRYLYLKGNKKEKKEMLEKLTLKILPYPKGDNRRYDASYQPKTQDLLF